jgi:hypothetical protein
LEANVRLVLLGLVAAVLGPGVAAQGQDVAWTTRYDRGVVQALPAIPAGIAPAPTGDVYVVGVLGANGGPASRTMLTRYDAMGSTVWSRSMDVGLAGAIVNAFAADSAGNVVLAVTGTRGEEGRGPSPENALLSYDAAGALRWKRPWPDRPLAAAAAPSGRFALAGQGPGNLNRVTLVDGQGAPLWTGDLPTISFISIGVAISVDATGNVCAGYSLSPPPGDIGVECRDAAGTLLWRRTYDNGGTDDQLETMVPRPGGGVYVAGKTSAGTQWQAWTLAIGPTGDVVWGATYGGAAGRNDLASALTVSPTGDVFVAGEETSAAGSRSIVLRYDAAGNPVYAVTFDVGRFFASPHGLGADASGNAYVAVAGASFVGPADAFTVRLDPSGNVVWTQSYGSSGTGASTSPVGMVVPPSGGAAVLVGTDARAMTTLRYSSAGVVDWTASPPALGIDETGTLAAVDGLGRLIVTGGAFSGTSSDDGLVTAFDPGGTLLWTRTLSGPVPRSVSTDRFGNVFLGLDFPGGVAKVGADGQVQWSLAGYGAALADDVGGAFVAGSVFSGGPRLRITRYGPSGDVVWTKDDLESPAGSLPLPVLQQDGAGGVVIAEGLFAAGNAYVFRQDQRVLRYAADGTALWATTLANPEADRDTPTSLAVDAAGSTFVSVLSWVQDPVIFTVSDTSLGLVKLDRYGKVLWTRSTPTGLPRVAVPPLHSIARVVLDGRGHAFLAGSRKTGSVGEIVLLCYDTAGAVVWQRAFDAGGTGASFSGALAVDGAGSVYVGGMADDGPTTDFLVVKYDAAGTLLWAHRLDGALGFDAATALAPGFGGAVYAAGTSWVEATGRDLLAVRYGTPPPGASFFTIQPCRVFDSRATTGGPSPVAAGGSLVVDVAGSGCGVPDSARAVAGNLAVAQPTAAGHIVIFPAGEPTPFGSALNYGPGQTRAANVVTGVSQGGRLVIRPFQADGSVHLILDVTGYYQ